MRPLLLALVCVAACPAIFMAQNKTLPSAPAVPRETDEGSIPSICDGISANVLLGYNCGFENGDFSDWTVYGPQDLINVDPSAANSGSFGALFGTIGDFTTVMSLSVATGQTYFVQFWLANKVGGSGTEIIAEWSADGQFDDTFTLLDLVDSDPFDWTLYSFGSLPSTSSGGTLAFLFRHDPDFWWLDDVDIEPSSSSASPIAARQASPTSQRIAP